MSDRVVTAAEFQTRAGQYVELAGKEPVTISKHGRPCRVLIDYDEYMRLRAYDRRRAFHAHEMDDDTAAALAMAEMSPRHGADDGLPDDA